MRSEVLRDVGTARLQDKALMLISRMRLEDEIDEEPISDADENSVLDNTTRVDNILRKKLGMDTEES